MTVAGRNFLEKLHAREAHILITVIQSSESLLVLARELGISHNVLKNNLYRLYTLTETKNRIGLSFWCLKHGVAKCLCGTVNHLLQAECDELKQGLRRAAAEIRSLRMGINGGR